MTRNRLIFPALLVVIAAIAAVIATTSGGTTKTTPAAPAGSAISLKQTSLGKTLVDANGRTLYLFQPDKANVSTLSAAGRAVWPPLTSTVKPQANGGASPAQVGTIANSQITYNGHPLYLFVGDHNAGQTTGQGLNEFGGRWYVLSAAGAAITSTPTAPGQTAPTAPSSGGSSYGY